MLVFRRSVVALGAVLLLASCTEPTDLVLASAKLERSAKGDTLVVTVKNDSDAEACFWGKEVAGKGYAPPVDGPITPEIDIWSATGKSKRNEQWPLESRIEPFSHLKAHEIRQGRYKLAGSLTSPLVDGDCIQVFRMYRPCVPGQGEQAPRDLLPAYSSIQGAWRVEHGRLIRIPRTAICLSPQNGSDHLGELSLLIPPDSFELRPPTPKDIMRTVQHDEADETIMFDVGDKFAIELIQYKGYRWSITHQPRFLSHLERVTGPTTKLNNREDSWIVEAFSVTSKGRGKVEMELRGPDGEIDEIFAIGIDSRLDP